ncbi:hypothetical protein CHELA17_60989 [Chelatococcus asaccharovorans]|nr:hypothetical protein CHELA17_60989 [Chelatococcus asaccharovorans]
MPLTTFETVIGDTPARRATSFKVARCRGRAWGDAASRVGEVLAVSRGGMDIRHCVRSPAAGSVGVTLNLFLTDGKCRTSRGGRPVDRILEKSLGFLDDSISVQSLSRRGQPG